MDLEFLVEHLPALLQATRITVGLTLATLLISTLLAVPLAIAGLAPGTWVSRAISLYSALMRSVPTLVILFFVYYGLPQIGLTLPAFATALIGLSLSATAYTLEIFRSGLRAVDVGQIEAARALGIPGWRIWRSIAFPQAMPIILPTYLSNATLVLKGTSVASIITISELTATANEIVSTTYQPFEILFASAVIYILLGGLMNGAAQLVGRTWRVQ